MDEMTNYEKFLEQIKNDPEIIWLAAKEQEAEIITLRQRVNELEAQLPFGYAVDYWELQIEKDKYKKQAESAQAAV